MTLDHRQIIKAEQFPKAPEAIKPQDILGAVMNILQTERGVMIEDEEAYNAQWDTAADLLIKHDADAKDASDLVDNILADMPGSATYRDPAISGRLLN